jgi:hypothetical protein
VVHQDGPEVASSLDIGGWGIAMKHDAISLMRVAAALFAVLVLAPDAGATPITYTITISAGSGTLVALAFPPPRRVGPTFFEEITGTFTVDPSTGTEISADITVTNDGSFPRFPGGTFTAATFPTATLTTFVSASVPDANLFPNQLAAEQGFCLGGIATSCVFYILAEGGDRGVHEAIALGFEHPFSNEPNKLIDFVQGDVALCPLPVEICQAGFDDIEASNTIVGSEVVGEADPNAPVPEPSSLAIISAAFGVLALTRLRAAFREPVARRRLL